MNVGIQDAHNLAWKLAGSVVGWGSDRLLESYEAERRPVAQAVNAEVMLNVREPGRREQWDNLGLILGTAYESTAVIPDGTPAPAASNPIRDYAPDARPGRRAPHLWLAREKETVSVLDVFGDRFVLLTGTDDEAWLGGLPASEGAAAVPFVHYRIDGDAGELRDVAGGWRALYGVDPSGAVLIRPDGHVAWRAARWAAAERSIRAVVDQVLGHSTPARK